MKTSETNSGFDASPDAKLRTNWRTVGVVIVAIISATLVVSQYTHSLERTIDRFDAKLTRMSEKLEEREEDMDKLRSEVVMRGPFYAWSGHFRYMVLTGAKDFPPEPRPFFEPNRYP
jgi:hypothetical protein